MVGGVSGSKEPEAGGSPVPTQGRQIPGKDRAARTHTAAAARLGGEPSKAAAQPIKESRVFSKKPLGTQPTALKTAQGHVVVPRSLEAQASSLEDQARSVSTWKRLAPNIPSFTYLRSDPLSQSDALKLRELVEGEGYQDCYIKQSSKDEWIVITSGVLRRPHDPSVISIATQHQFSKEGALHIMSLLGRYVHDSFSFDNPVNRMSCGFTASVNGEEMFKIENYSVTKSPESRKHALDLARHYLSEILRQTSQDPNPSQVEISITLKSVLHDYTINVSAGPHTPEAADHKTTWP